MSNALTMNLPKDLRLTGNQPNIALTIFLVPYILFELPSNLVMKNIRPHMWLGGSTVAFGLIMLGQGFVRSYFGLLATSFLLGLAEAGIFPGSFYLISFWYKREEAQKRFTVYWCSTIIASAFGGLLASAIALLDGTQGLPNWRWLFILEGLGTIVVGVAAYFLVPDFPEQASWLTYEEKDFIMRRNGTLKQHLQVALADIRSFFTDPKCIIGAIMYWGIIVPLCAYAYFAPTQLKSLGLGVVQTQLRSVLPAAAAAALVLCLIIAFLSDRARIRSPFILFTMCMLAAGMATLLRVHHRFPVRYAALCLIAMGALSTGPMIVCWYVMNLQGHAERSIGTPSMISFGNTGGVLATFTFLSKDAPYFERGYSICLGALAVSAVSCLIYGVLIWREKKNRLSQRTWSYRGNNRGGAALEAPGWCPGCSDRPNGGMWSIRS